MNMLAAEHRQSYWLSGSLMVYLLTKLSQGKIPGSGLISTICNASCAGSESECKILEVASDVLFIITIFGATEQISLL